MRGKRAYFYYQIKLMVYCAMRIYLCTASKAVPLRLLILGRYAYPQSIVLLIVLLVLCGCFGRFSWPSSALCLWVWGLPALNRLCITVSSIKDSCSKPGIYKRNCCKPHSAWLMGSCKTNGLTRLRNCLSCVCIWQIFVCSARCYSSCVQWALLISTASVKQRCGVCARVWYCL